MAGGSQGERAHQAGASSGVRRSRLYLPWPLVPVAVLAYLVIIVVAAPFWLIERLFGPGRLRVPGR